MDRHAVSALVRPPPPIPGSTLPNPELLPGRAARSKNLGDQAQIWCSAWARKSQTAEVRCQSALETLHVLEDNEKSKFASLLSPAAHQVSEVSEQVGDPGGNREGEDPAEGVRFC